MTQNYISEGDRDFFDFTEMELKANRSGQLTAGQLERIKSLASSEKKTQKTIAIVMFLFFVILFLAIYFLDPSFRNQIEDFNLLWFFLALGIPLIALVVSFLVGRKKSDDFAEATIVNVVKGPAKKKHQFSDALHGFQIEIDGVKFPVHEAFYPQIEEGHSYAFYYVEATNYNLILSWEKI